MADASIREQLEADARTWGWRVAAEAAEASAPLVYVIDAPEHPFDAAPLERPRAATVVVVPLSHWNDLLTPWPASALYRGEEDFGGHAAETLDELCCLMHRFEAQTHRTPRARALCGYSLGGLFALYGLVEAPRMFDACACVSGSVWYEGWVEHLRSLDLDLTRHAAFLSVGSKERRAAPPLLKTVQDNMEATARLLEERGAHVHAEVGPGNHFQHVSERLDAGLTFLDTSLGRLPL